MAALTLWGRRSSFNVQKVAWLIGELAIDHQHIEAGGSFGGLDSAEFTAMNPHRKVPVIRDGDAVVWESHTILRYLAARYARDRFWHPDPAKRALAEQWMDWSQTALQPAFLNGIFWGYYRTPAAQRDTAAIEASLERCNACMRKLDRQLDGSRYLLGEEFSLADIPAGCNLFRYFNLDITRPDLPNVTAWYARLSERPAYREHVMLPFDDLFGRLQY